MTLNRDDIAMIQGMMQQMMDRYERHLDEIKDSYADEQKEHKIKLDAIAAAKLTTNRFIISVIVSFFSGAGLLVIGEILKSIWH